MGITNLQVDDDGTMGCEVKYEVPLDYSYTLKKWNDMNDNILKIVIVDDEEAAIDNLCLN